MSGKVTIPGDVYAWIAVFVLPINSAMNPILYTLSSIDLVKYVQAICHLHMERVSFPKRSHFENGAQFSKI
jgi:hypothetical protein